MATDARLDDRSPAAEVRRVRAALMEPGALFEVQGEDVRGNVMQVFRNVDEAAVFAVDDEVTGDAVCAVAVLRQGSTATTAELAEWCRERLAHFKVPTLWYFLDGALPRTPSGKLIKREPWSWIDADPAATNDRGVGFRRG